MTAEVVALVFGSRDGETFLQARSQARSGIVDAALDAFDRRQRISLVLHGDARSFIQGAVSFDRLAERWAKQNERPYLGWPARWRTGTEKNGEGPIRNARMRDLLLHLQSSNGRSGVGIEFPGGKGTEGMSALLADAKVPVWRVVVTGNGWRLVAPPREVA